MACGGGRSLAPVPATLAAGFDRGAREELAERWSALRIGSLATAAPGTAPAIVVRRVASMDPQAYRLTVTRAGAEIDASGDAGAFYGAMTLAQLPVRGAGGWGVPCVRIEDRPAMRWRVLSDDVSRGPLPTMRYFEERIRTIAAFKMNGYSPYMEHVFVSPTDPLPAPLDGITPAQLSELSRYAARFHVALIPEQQSFAHMHGTLRIERYAAAAELPHGMLISPQSELGTAYLTRVIGQELDAVGRPPFFHIGSDETATLGAGTTAAYVARVGRTQAFADHVVAMNALVAPSGARTMLWDDAVEQDANILKLVPSNVVFANWHYGVEPTYRPYIDRIARGGFEQMVSPGARNWNEIFPNVPAALANERRFVADGQDARVLGLFQTVWHDDGETLYEATWYPVLFAAAAAWQAGGAQPQRFAADFPEAFFGAADARYADDVAALGAISAQLDGPAHGNTDALFWSDAFDPAVAARVAGVDVAALRRGAESVEQHLIDARPPLHAGAAFAMVLAARRYDVLGRNLQIASEVRAMYADAKAHAAEPDGPSLRDLFWCRYWLWEQRDAFEELAPLYERAWRYENRESHLAGNLERYHLAAQRAIERADAVYRATYDDFVPSKTLPPLDGLLGLPASAAQP